jgi:hypothetical protein
MRTWCIRGRGGNFAIVTSFEFRAHPAGTVLAGLMLHPASQGRDAMRFFGEFETTEAQEMSNSILIFTAPPEMPLPESLRVGPPVGRWEICKEVNLRFNRCVAEASDDSRIF